MKNYPPLLFLILISVLGYGQNYESKYAVFDKKMVMLKGIKENSELVCVVPKGNAVRIMEKLNGPIYKAQYKNWNGYIISFKLKNQLESNPGNLKKQQFDHKWTGKKYVTLSRKTYITKKTDYKMVIAVPKRQTLEVLDRVKKGKYLVKYKNHIGFAELGGYNVQNEVTQALLATMKINKSAQAKRVVEQYPPIINVDDISFSKNVLSAGASNQLKITLRNTGMGDAKNVYVRLTSQNRGIEHPEISHFPEIEAEGGMRSMIINVDGNKYLEDGIASLSIEVVEPKFRGQIPIRQLRFQTEELPKPILVIADYKVREIPSGQSNNKIDNNEMLDLSFTIKNVGKANATQLEIDVKCDQQGVMFLGEVKDLTMKESNVAMKSIFPGDNLTMTYRYFVNSDFQDQKLNFKVKASDRFNGFDFSANLIIPIYQKTGLEGQNTAVSIVSNYEPKSEFLISEFAEIIDDVDKDIPVTNVRQNSTYALIIGNEDYKSRQRTLSIEQNANYSLNDAEVFRNYCQRTLGVPAKQIKILRNATAAEISQGLAWINNLAKIENGDAKLIFYYSGHGMANEETKSPVIIPVDVSANNLEYGIQLSDAFYLLTEHPARQVTVFLDACFSGGGRNQGLFPNKGIKVKANKNVILGNMVVFSSSSSEETSFIFEEAKHGYFTYFLLKKLKETKGNVDYHELSDYLIRSVRKEAGLNGIVQTPEVYFSQKVTDSWKEWQLK